MSKRKLSNILVVFLIVMFSSICSLMFLSPTQAFKEPSFSIVIIPDCQDYTTYFDHGYPEILYGQMDWIVANKTNYNIQWVGTTGDLINDDVGYPTATAYGYCNRSWMKLYNASIPYGILPGNHDPTSVWNPVVPGLTAFNPSKLSAFSWWGGAYDSNNRINYQRINIYGMNFTFLNVRYSRTGTLALTTAEKNWCYNVMDTHPDDRFIVIAHMGLYADKTWDANMDSGIYSICNRNDNTFLFICGHTGVMSYTRNDTHFDHSMLAYMWDYQTSCGNGGDGWLALITFYPNKDLMRCQTFSPTTIHDNAFPGWDWNADVDIATHQYAVPDRNYTSPYGCFYDKWWGYEMSSYVSPGETGDKPNLTGINYKGNGTSINDATPIFSWTICENASRYHLQVSNNSIFTSLVVNISNISLVNYPGYYSENLTCVSFELPYLYHLEYTKTYYVRVRAYEY